MIGLDMVDIHDHGRWEMGGRGRGRGVGLAGRWLVQARAHLHANTKAGEC